MKKFLLVLALVAVSGLSADLQQGWQDFKQKSTEFGQKIIDPVNFPKYKKLLDAAQDELDACAIAECGKLKVARHQDRCVKKKCAQQAELVQKWSAEHKKRTVGAIVAGVLAGGAVATVGVGAGAARVQTHLQMKRINEVLEMYRATDGPFDQRQENFLREVIAHKLYKTGKIEDIILAYPDMDEDTRQTAQNIINSTML